MLRLPLAVLLVIVLAPAARAQEGVFLTTSQAIHEVFPDAAGVVPHRWHASAAEQSAVARQLGRPAPADYPFLLVYDAGQQLLGYALVTEERGKYRPITFLVGITPRLEVRDVAIMVYRESRGGEVRQRRFLRQYEGKSARDPIRPGSDIVGISGATISVRSVSIGVKRTLAAARLAFDGGPPTVARAEVQPLAALR
jgi:Na+-translocating ferredoxin:NAD+ oxidoreductase RnfG subunit